MPVRQTLDQLNADARQHCDGCERCETLKDSWVMCSGVRVGFVNGKCPIERWDHSAPIEHEPTTRVRLYKLCVERIAEEWPQDWQAKLRAAAVRTSGRAILIPRALYDEALKNRK